MLCIYYNFFDNLIFVDDKLPEKQQKFKNLYIYGRLNFFNPSLTG